jgi:hypothetical protein
MAIQQPRILPIKRNPLNVLRKTSAQVRRRRTGSQVLCKLSGIRNIVRRILRELVQRFVIAGERAIEHRLMDQVHAKLQRMAALRLA